MTRPILALVVTAFMVVIRPVLASAQSSPTLTLEEAVRMALARNTTIDSASLAEAQAAEELAAARTRRLPAFSLETQVSRLLRPVDLTFPAGAFGSFPSTGPVPSVDTTVSTPARVTMLLNATASQPVMGLIQVGLGIRQSETARALAHQDVRAARLGVIRQVKQAYYGILEAMSALKATETNARVLAELGRVVANRVMQQVALKADSLEVEARQAQNELTQIALRHALASRKEQLNHLLGRDLATDFDVVPAWDTVAAATAAELTSGPDDRPDVRQAQLRLQQADLAVRRAAADRLPDVNLLMQTISPVNIDGAPRNIMSAGVQVKWEPFDWGRKARTVAARRLDARRADQALRDAATAAQLEINQARRAVERTRAGLRAAVLAQNVAREHARVRATQYQTQAVLLSDVLQAQSSLAETTKQYQQAVLALLTAQADLDHALGEDLIP